MNDNGSNGSGLWKAAALALLSLMVGWWSRQLTLEIPPKWFQDRVDGNAGQIAQHERRIDELEKGGGDLAEIADLLRKLLESQK